MPLHELEIVTTDYLSPEYCLDHCTVVTTKQLILCVLGIWITPITDVRSILWNIINILNSTIQLMLYISWFKTAAGHIAVYVHVLQQSISIYQALVKSFYDGVLQSCRYCLENYNLSKWGLQLVN